MQLQRALRDVDADDVAILDQRDGAAGNCSVILEASSPGAGMIPRKSYDLGVSMAGAAGRLVFSNDISRDVELLEYGLDASLDTPLLPNSAVMNALQNLVRLATQLCGAPFGVVNIISAGHQHQIGAWGVDPRVCSREDSMCAKVFLSREKTVVSDASRDPRFADSPFVTGEIGTVLSTPRFPWKPSPGSCRAHYVSFPKLPTS
ncbi:GAF domain-containing protein [Arthrobacter globiformis]|uniref:GAF domain-containing protein n=1 Tax=Arthrobacter globiformis TaxID=1665 RepID=UPI002783143D|nr:hypothetical protein [Arthrobacter globiformis]